jgi:hypothetical protein
MRLGAIKRLIAIHRLPAAFAHIEMWADLSPVRELMTLGVILDRHSLSITVRISIFPRLHWLTSFRVYYRFAIGIGYWSFRCLVRLL